MVSLHRYRAAAQQHEIVIGAGNFAPYFIADEHSGVFTDIINAAFEHLPQYQVTFRFGLSVNRMVNDFEEGRLDATANIFADHEVEGCKTDPVFRFQDVAVTLKEKHLTISTIADLKDKRIIVYQGATTFLGQNFHIMAAYNPYYKETAKPYLQPRMVATGRVDVSVGDIYMFFHNLPEWSNGQAAPEQFEVHEIFPVLYTHLVFRDSALCEEFNRALRIIQENGRYEAIYQRYLQQVGYKVEDDAP